MKFSKTYFHAYLASEVSRISRWFDELIVWQPDQNKFSQIVNFVQNKNIKVISDYNEIIGNNTKNLRQRRVLLLDGTLNNDVDFEVHLAEFFARLTRFDRIVAVTYNPYLRWMYYFISFFGLGSDGLPKVFLTKASLRGIAKLHHYEVVRTRPVLIIPFSFFGLATILNSFISSVPFFRWFCIACVITLRPIKKDTSLPSLSVIVPARNEEKNIFPLLDQLPRIPDVDLEVVFVEGHSRDNTWAEILAAKQKYGADIQIQTWQQTGTGKGDAVRMGVEKSQKDLVVILDADITVPPADLFRFYSAYVNGDADFVNGSRLLYPMEHGAMRFMNWLGNIFFAKTLSFVLETELTDSLCGTKLFCRDDFKRMQLWREDFGKIDPFGDFDLLFFAAQLGLGVMNVHVHYKSRTYGETNILRFRHGVVLFAMTLFGGFKLRFGPGHLAERHK